MSEAQALTINVDQFRDPAKTFLLGLYDTHVVPHDFPRIPNLLEPRIKAVLREMIPGVVDTAFDFFKQPDAAAKTAKAAGDAFQFLLAPKAE